MQVFQTPNTWANAVKSRELGPRAFYSVTSIITDVQSEYPVAAFTTVFKYMCSTINFTTSLFLTIILPLSHCLSINPPTHVDPHGNH